MRKITKEILSMIALIVVMVVAFMGLCLIFPPEPPTVKLAQMNRRQLTMFAMKNKVQITQSLTEPLISEDGIRARIYDTLKARGYKII